MSRDAAEARVQRLLRWYPRRWRERYGEEFAELLVAELDEHAHSWRRTADIARSGLIARLSVIGLARGPVGGAASSLGAAVVALVAFLGCGLSLWSQLLTGWRWSSLDAHDLRFGVLAMSVAGVCLAVVTLLAAAPVVATVVRRLQAREAGDGHRVVLPLVVLVLGVAFLVAGGHTVQHAWPGAGGHSTHLRRLVPGGMAGFGWAETLAITAYWIHPGELLALPTTQVAWIASSPLALLGAVMAAVTVVRRVPLSAAVLRYEARLAEAAAGAMAVFLVAAGWWVGASRTAGNPVFRAGTLDLLLVMVMAASLSVAAAASRRLRLG